MPWQAEPSLTNNYTNMLHRKWYQLTTKQTQDAKRILLPTKIHTKKQLLLPPFPCPLIKPNSSPINNYSSPLLSSPLSMATMFWKNLHLCFPSKLKLSSESQYLIPPNPNSNFTQQPPPPSEAEPENVVLKNFNSLFDFSTSSAYSTDIFSSDSDSDVDSPPDFAALFASQRFFFSSPGSSNSIVESPDTKPRDSIEIPPLDGGVAVKKFSPDPYKDFRCSMLEMIEARKDTDVRRDWEFLHELLFCYLSMNPKQNHKFIISAFSDILICLISSPERLPAARM